MTSRGWWLILLSGSLMVAANLLVRLGMDRCDVVWRRLSDLPRIFPCLVVQPAFDVGVLTFVVATLLWFHIVATEPLGTALPILISVTFVLVVFGASVLFNEPITMVKLLGLTVIISGMALISY